MIMVVISLCQLHSNRWKFARKATTAAATASVAAKQLVVAVVGFALTAAATTVHGDIKRWPSYYRYYYH